VHLACQQTILTTYGHRLAASPEASRFSCLSPCSDGGGSFDVCFGIEGNLSTRLALGCGDKGGEASQ
jgi:hypothetical protein